MPRRKIPIEQLFKNDTVTIEWLKSQNKTTLKTYRYAWKQFLEFTGKNGSELLELRKTSSNGEIKRLILDFRNWLISKKGKSENSAKTCVMAVLGFFSFYELPVRFTRGESDRIKRVRRKSQDYWFSIEDLRKMASVGNLKEKYVLVVGKSLGLRASDFIRLTYGDFRKLDLNQEPPIPLGEISTVKEGIKAYPMLDSDAVEVIKLILKQQKTITKEVKDKNGEIKKIKLKIPYKDSERILNVRKKELSVILRRLAERANIQTGNTKIRFHCLRKFLINQLSRYMSETKWKLIIGKKVPENAYVSPDTLREDFKRAMKSIVFQNHEKVAQIARLQEMVAKLVAENQELKKIIARLQQAQNDTAKRINTAFEHIEKLNKAILSLKAEKQPQPTTEPTDQPQP